MLTPEQVEKRRTGITATDVAKILKLSPYGGPIDVLLEKQGNALPFIETDRVKWGNILEDPIRKDYEERTGLTVRSGDDIGTLTHPKRDWMMATPDGLAYDPPEKGSRLVHGHEIKTHTGWLSHHYGDSGSDLVPDWEAIQCHWCMAVTDVDEWVLTVFMDGLPRDYKISRDPELEATMIATCAEFWERHVVRGEPLEADGTPSWDFFLKQTYPKNADPIRQASTEESAMAAQLRSARERLKASSDEVSMIEQQLKFKIGSASGIELPDDPETDKPQKITWRRSRPGTKTEWKKVAQAYRNQIELVASTTPGGADLIKSMDETLAAHTTPTEGTRRFNVPAHWSPRK